MNLLIFFANLPVLRVNLIIYFVDLPFLCAYLFPGSSQFLLARLALLPKLINL
jgi:hypothetical protein